MKIELRNSKFWFVLASLVLMIYFFVSCPYLSNTSNSAEISGNWLTEIDVTAELIPIGETIYLSSAEDMGKLLQLIYNNETCQTVNKKYDSLNYVLTNNIDLGTNKDKNKTMYWSPIPHFYGTFNGNGFKIQNMKIKYDSTSYQPVKNNANWAYKCAGLFAMVGNTTDKGSPIIENLTMENCSVDSACKTERSIGIIVGYNYAIIRNCRINNCSINTQNINNNNESENVYIGAVSGYCYTGTYDKSIITNCFVTNFSFNPPTFKLNGGRCLNLYLGGIVGYANSADILLCSYTNSTLDSNDMSDTTYIGGIAGAIFNQSKIEKCHNSSTIYGGGNGSDIATKVAYVAGITGYCKSSEIAKCYNTGSISGKTSREQILVFEENINNSTHNIQYIGGPDDKWYNKTSPDDFSAYFIVPSSKSAQSVYNYGSWRMCINKEISGSYKGSDSSHNKEYLKGNLCFTAGIAGRVATSSVTSVYNSGKLYTNNNVTYYIEQAFKIVYVLASAVLPEQLQILGAAYYNLLLKNIFKLDISLAGEVYSWWDNISNSTPTSLYSANGDKSVDNQKFKGFSYEQQYYYNSSHISDKMEISGFQNSINYSAGSAWSNVSNSKSWYLDYNKTGNKGLNRYKINFGVLANAETGVVQLYTRKFYRDFGLEYENENPSVYVNKDFSYFINNNYSITKTASQLKSILCDGDWQAGDRNINNGLPYIKDLYWKHNTLEPPSSYTLEYKYNNNGTASVKGTSFLGNVRSVEIPETVIYEGTTYTVTAIENAVFKGRTTIQKVTLPSTLKTIGEQTFRDCINLTTINLNNVTKLMYACFQGCKKLTNITLSNKLYYMGKSIFEGCISLKLLDLSLCEKLVKKDISVNGCQFKNCTNLTTVLLPAKMPILTKDMFAGCSSLNRIEYGGNECDWFKINSNNIASIKSGTVIVTKTYTYVLNSFTYEYDILNDKEIKLKDVDFNGLSEYIEVPEVIDGKTVVELKNNIFEGYGIRTLTLPSSVTLIGSNAFVNCYALKYIIYNGTTKQWSDNFGNKTFGIPYGNTVTVVCTNGNITITG